MGRSASPLSEDSSNKSLLSHTKARHGLKARCFPPQAKGERLNMALPQGTSSLWNKRRLIFKARNSEGMTSMFSVSSVIQNRQAALLMGVSFFPHALETLCGKRANTHGSCPFAEGGSILFSVGFPVLHTCRPRAHLLRPWEGCRDPHRHLCAQVSNLWGGWRHAGVGASAFPVSSLTAEWWAHANWERRLFCTLGGNGAQLPVRGWASIGSTNSLLKYA